MHDRYEKKKFMFNKDINNKFHEIIIRKKIVMIFFSQ